MEVNLKPSLPILPTISYPKMPKQNGRAEQNIKHVETSLALLAMHSSLKNSGHMHSIQPSFS